MTTARDRLADGLSAMTAEGGGVWAIEAYSPQGGLELVARAKLGDDSAAKRVEALNRFFDELERRGPKNRMLCAACDNALPELPRLVALVTADRDDPKHALALGLCDECADEVEPALMRAMRRVAPDARKLDVHAGSGTA